MNACSVQSDNVQQIQVKVERALTSFIVEHTNQDGGQGKCEYMFRIKQSTEVTVQKSTYSLHCVDHVDQVRKEGMENLM